MSGLNAVVAVTFSSALAMSGSCSARLGQAGVSDWFADTVGFCSIPSSLLTVDDRSTSLAVTWALGQDMSPSLNGFVLTKSPSERLERSLADRL